MECLEEDEDVTKQEGNLVKVGALPSLTLRNLKTRSKESWQFDPDFRKVFDHKDCLIAIIIIEANTLSRHLLALQVSYFERHCCLRDSQATFATTK